MSRTPRPTPSHTRARKHVDKPALKLTRQMGLCIRTRMGPTSADRLACHVARHVLQNTNTRQMERTLSLRARG